MTTPARRKEDLMDRTLRWMSENLKGAQNARYPRGHQNAGRHCTNSGTGILVCCYINALGKVLLKGSKGDSRRFKKFVTECMQEFLQAKSTKALPPTPGKKTKTGGEHWLYDVYRCGFVHAYYPGDAKWARSTSGLYWFRTKGKVTLNIDRLVLGFEKGIEEFKLRAEADPDLRVNFGKHLTAGD